MKVTKLRSLLKTLSWRCIASLDTFKVCMMQYDNDYLDIAATSMVRTGNYWADQSGTSKDPYLDYTAAVTATDNSVFFGCNF